MKSSPLTSPRFLSRRSPGARAFTLIELLVVMAVIVILASITFGITRGVQTAQARSKAQGELAALSQALESFKLRYGDYPWINEGVDNVRSSHQLLQALTGFRDARGNVIPQPTGSQQRQNFIDTTRFSLSQQNWDGVAVPPATLYFIDPWGNPYVYLYRAPVSGTDPVATPPAWQRFGFVLYSRGPQGQSAFPGLDLDSGLFRDTNYREDPLNIGKIFAGE